MDFDKLLSQDEQTAIAILQAGGFKAFTDAKMADVRELGTGLRRRTFRNRGRYQLVLACQNLEGRQLPDTAWQSRATGSKPVVETIENLRAAYPDLCRQLLDQASLPVETGMPDPDTKADSVPEIPPVELKPVKDMLKEELLAEARSYPDITGEHNMNKPELAAAVQAQRNRRALLFKTFKV